MLTAVSGTLDLIVANLPYIPDADVPSLQPEVSQYEPRIALGGGPDGLSLIRQLLAQAQHVLSPQGAIMLEITRPRVPPYPVRRWTLSPPPMFGSFKTWRGATVLWP